MLSEKYSKLKTLEEARRIFLNKVDFPLLIGEERITVNESVYRISSRPVFSLISSPHFLASAMDGFAVDARSRNLSGDGNRKRLKVNIDAFPVNTGDPLPNGTNTVVPIEKVSQIDSAFITLDDAHNPWEHLRIIAEDVSRGELIIPLNHLVAPLDVGLLLSSGVKELWVRRRPKVLIIPTGAELFDLCENKLRHLKKGRIIEFDSHIVYHSLKDAGAVPARHAIVANKKTLVRTLLEKTNDFDLIIIIGAASVGSRDFTGEAIRASGELLVNGVRMRPGKPTLLGIIEGKPVIGLPGYPVAAVISFREFVLPIVERILGFSQKRTLRVITAETIKPDTGFDEFIRVKIVKNGNGYLALPLRKGISIISPLSKADGIIRIPFDSQGLNEGDLVECDLLKNIDIIKKNLVIVGEEDPIFGILDTLLREAVGGSQVGNLSFLNQGTLGGIVALRKRFSQSSIVSFSDDTEEMFQIMSLLQMEKQIRWRLIRMAKRELGLIFAKDNSKNINSLADIVRDDVNFVNRQYGSSPRTYLDKEIEKLGITKEEINGYNIELYTHVSVAIQIQEGFADVGLGIYPVAKAHDLGFIPFAKESYDLLVTEEFMKENTFSLITHILRSQKFQEKLEAMGYYMNETGNIIS